MGTMVLILPPFAVDGQVNIERKAFRAKSPEPPMPFIMSSTSTWVLLTLPHVDLDGGVDGNDADPPNHLRAVGDFLRTQRRRVPEELPVFIDTFSARWSP